MGKKSKGKQNNETYPFVSICTPTFNRRPFIQAMISCFEHQTYPKSRMEWIILDDGTDKIGDLVESIPQVKYISHETQMVLGKKRNMLHEATKGEIIVYMDDDDYYPPERVSHAVHMLQTHPKALCAGASEIYIYFKHINQMMQFGPYGPQHATAGTFAFRRELLKEHRYNDTAALAEERSFLKAYTVPFVQLEPKKTILVFSHEHNTFDKKTLLDSPHPQFVRKSDKTVDDFIKNKDLKDFYMNQIEKLLSNYDAGKPSMKPRVLKQIKELQKEREALMKQHMEQQMDRQKLMGQNPGMMPSQPNNLPETAEDLAKLIHTNQMMLQQNQMAIQMFVQKAAGSQIMGDINGKPTVLNNDQVVHILDEQQKALAHLTSELAEKDKLIQTLRDEINSQI